VRPLPRLIVVLVAETIGSNLRICLHVFRKLVSDVFDVDAVRIRPLVYIAVARRSSLEYRKVHSARYILLLCDSWIRAQSLV